MFYKLLLSLDYKLDGAFFFDAVRKILLLIGRKKAEAYADDHIHIRNVFWPLVAFYHHKVYVSKFSQGEIISAYKHKARCALMVAKYMRGNYRHEAVNYLDLLSYAGILIKLLGSPDFSYYKRNIKNHNFKLSWKINFGDNDKSISVIGPLKDNLQADKGCDVLCIKPERFEEQITFPIFSYYNTEDLNNHYEKVNRMKKDNKLLKVLTTNNLFFYQDWVVPAISVHITFMSVLPLAIVTIINSLTVFGYGNIRLAGFNFYLGDLIYSEKYYSSLKESSGRVSSEKFLMSLSNHDLLANYILLRSYLEAGIITVDKDLSYMKDTSAWDYVRQFENSL